MFNEFYAHSDPNNPKKLPNDPGARWQPLKEHLVGVSELATHFAQQASPGDKEFANIAKWSGLLHDLGKCSDKFQQMLTDVVQGKPKIRAPHAVYGAALANNAKAYDIALAVLGHHSGLHAAVDLKSKITSEEFEKARKYVRDRACLPADLREALHGNLPKCKITMGAELAFELRNRMLFSCLIDADRQDCLKHELGYLPESQPLNADGLQRQLLDYINECSKKSQVNKVNIARNAVLQTCLAAANVNERLLSLTVPTGGGKTLASMAFALNRAILRPNEVRRIIVVIPFLSIIEQNAQVYAKALGPNTILEHHSGDFNRLKKVNGEFRPLPEIEDDFYDPIERRFQLATENWDAPIIVTTSVRFFESLFSNRPSDLRRLHNIARSVVILDEVQTLPKGFLGTLLSMIRGLADEWQTTFVFCTATQPAFEKHSSAKEDDMRWERGTVKPIIPEDMQHELFRNLKRVIDPYWPNTDEKSSWAQIAGQMVNEQSVLCIVNTKQQALDLHAEMINQLSESDNNSSELFHLSTRMCAQHRLDKLEEIRELMTNSNRLCRVVSTQLVEAGVDLDFPVVFRAMGPLDAITQAGGRCDREGKMTAAAGKPAGRLIVFLPEDDRTPYKRETDITKCLAERGSLSIHNPLHMQAYFNEVYEGDRDPENIEGLRRSFNYPEVAERFGMIDQRTKAVLVPYNDESWELIEQIERSRGFNRDLLRKAQRYQVGLYPNEFSKAFKLGTIVELWPDSDLWKCCPSCYSRDVGLVIRPPSPEDYMA